MVYEKVSSDMNFVDREKQVEKFWKDNDIFQKSIDNRKKGETYTFYDGPPTANGKPHIGHVLTRVIKDMIPRYRTMKGYMVPRKAGWDTHGLPVELELEKELGLDGKEQIEEYGLEPFIKKCKESVWKYKGMWEDFSSTVGFWADMDNPYITYDDNFIESEWWALKQIWDKGLLYKGFKIVPYCPRWIASSQQVQRRHACAECRSQRYSAASLGCRLRTGGSFLGYYYQAYVDAQGYQGGFGEGLEDIGIARGVVAVESISYCVGYCSPGNKYHYRTYYY